MKAKRIVVPALFAAGFALVALVAAPHDVDAQGAPPKGAPAKPAPPAKGKGKDAKPAAAAANAPTVGKPITIQPKDMSWGIDRKKLGQIYDKVIDEDYKPKYLKVQPGADMESLDAEVAEAKGQFRRSLIEFKEIATGMDSTPMRSEYTYNNKESMMSIERGGKTRHFFFIDNKLYKVADELKLGEKAVWGKDFNEAVAKLNKYYAVDGRVREPDPAQGRPFKEVDWKDSTTEVRAVDWDNGKFAIYFQDAATVANLPNLRKNKEKETGKVDDSVSNVMRDKKAPPPPKPDDKKPGDKKPAAPAPKK
jgi:hypothetical protein